MTPPAVPSVAGDEAEALLADYGAAAYRHGALTQLGSSMLPLVMWLDDDGQNVAGAARLSGRKTTASGSKGE